MLREEEKIVLTSSGKRRTSIKDKETYVRKIATYLKRLENLKKDNISVDDVNSKICHTLYEAQQRHSEKIKNKEEKLSQNIRSLIRERRKMRKNTISENVKNDH